MPKIMPTIVLVHGAWTDASSWNRVIPLLLAKGFPVTAVQIPLSSLEDDVRATDRRLADIAGPIVLVGHSWGGMAVTQAGADPKVKALVYIAAFAPDVGETGGGLIGEHPASPALSTIVTDGSGFVFQTTEGMLNNIAPDLPETEARTMAVTQGRLAAKAFGETVSIASWKSKPSWYVLSTRDRVIGPQLQTVFVARMKAKATVLSSGHMSPASHPAEVVEVIEAAAATVDA